jgi:citrate lyase synthetase
MHNGHFYLVRLVCLQMDNFHLFLCQQTDKQQTFVCTIRKQYTDERKSPEIPFSVKRQHIYILKWQHIYIYWLQTKLKTSVDLLQIETENGSLFSLVVKE